MPARRLPLINKEFYHVFNRSVGSEKILTYPSDLKRAIRLINFYRFPIIASYSHIQQLSGAVREARLQQIFSQKPLVEVLAFSLMPNHFHFVVIQLEDEGIESFLSNFQNSYARYYNIKHNRHGTVFSNRFKGVRIESEEQLFHVVRYAELNPVTSYLIEIDDLTAYPYTSFSSYMNKSFQPFISQEIVMNHFKEIGRYKEFVFNQSDYQRSLKEIKDLLLD